MTQQSRAHAPTRALARIPTLAAPAGRGEVVSDARARDGTAECTNVFIIKLVKDH
jgi:hypothetical protein